MTPDQVPDAHVAAFTRAWNNHTGTPAPEDAVRAALAATLPDIQGDLLMDLAYIAVGTGEKASRAGRLQSFLAGKTITRQRQFIADFLAGAAGIMRAG